MLKYREQDEAWERKKEEQMEEKTRLQAIADFEKAVKVGPIIHLRTVRLERGRGNGSKPLFYVFIGCEVVAYASRASWSRLG